MKTKINYGSGVISIPESIMSGCISRASKTDLCVLITIAATQRDNLTEEQLTALANISPTELKKSMAFWRGAGIVVCDEDEKDEIETAPKKEPPKAKEPKEQKPKILEAENEMPKYTSEQITKFITDHKDTAELIDACQQTLGKIFNTSDISSLIAMRDYLNLGTDYILFLMSYCSKKDKKSLRYIEKMAITLHDAEIDTYAALEAHLNMMDRLNETESKIRKIFGINDRALTKKEKAHITTWINEYKYDAAIIEQAYEITISKINEPSIPYTNAILEKWHAQNLRTTEEISAYIDSAKKEKSQGTSSIDLEDFFNAALKKSYE